MIGSSKGTLGYLLFQTLTAGVPLYGLLSGMVFLLDRAQSGESKMKEYLVEDVYGPAFVFAVDVSLIMSFPGSLACDRLGPRSSAILGQILLMLGCVALGLAARQSATLQDEDFGLAPGSAAVTTTTVETTMAADPSASGLSLMQMGIGDVQCSEGPTMFESSMGSAMMSNCAESFREVSSFLELSGAGGGTKTAVRNLTLLGAFFNGCAGPFAIVSAQMAIKVVFPELMTGMSVSLIQGAYDASAVVFTFLALGVRAFPASVNAIPTAMSEYQWMMYGYCVFLLAHATVVWWLYAKERGDALLRKGKSSIDIQKVKIAGIDRRTLNSKQEVETLISGSGIDGGGEPLVVAAEKNKAVPAAEMDEAVPAAETHVPVRGLFQNPKVKPKDLSLGGCLTDIDYLMYVFWLGPQFFTFTFYMANAYRYLTPFWNRVNSFSYGISIGTAILTGFLFDRVKRKSLVLVFTTVLGLVFHGFITFCLSGKYDFPESQQWIILVLLCAYRSSIFSCLWIYFPTFFPLTHMGSMYGFAIFTCFFAIRIINFFCVTDADMSVQKNRWVTNEKWLGALSLVAVVYTGWLAYRGY